MKSPEVQFTPEDRLILDSYRQMLDGLAQYLGMKKLNWCCIAWKTWNIRQFG